MSDKLYRFDVQHSSGKVEQWSNKNGKYVLAQDAVKLQATIAELEDTLTADQALSDVVCMDKDKRITELKLRIAELTDELQWVYNKTNEQHILSRVAKIFPPENR